MLQVRHVFEEHKEEINYFYSFLEDLLIHDGRLVIDPPVNTIKTIKVETIAVLKSSFFLMLYNCIESTVSNCLKAALQAVETDNCKYIDLNESLKLSSLAAYDYMVQQAETKEIRNKMLKEQNDFSSGYATLRIELKPFVGSTAQGTFSGSLDAEAIQKHFARLGLDTSTMSCTEMRSIKSCRNKLAHGDCSFEEYGRNLTIQYIEVCKDRTLTYLESLINKVDVYIQVKDYRRHDETIEKMGFLSRILLHPINTFLSLFK